ncbi:phosphotransferase [Streptomyces sp. AC495_CC817]|uniref:phosphotransferase n=1 Tax=Streptomyces sp. AC495_CC817 TaxID=2823900 RepID=UPI0027E0D1D7|nr:phosphotransferase [Streptomyces sp. AC495_CC817]
MDDGQLDVDPAAAALLIADQFPHWAGLDVRRVDSDGTVNLIYRLGETYSLRFPLNVAESEELALTLAAEHSAMNAFAGVSTVPSPTPVAVGAPGPGYPQQWSVHTWVQGEVATPTAHASSAVLARDVAALLRALRSTDTQGATFSGAGRGGDLRDSDDWMEVCFRESEGLLPVSQLRALWREFRELPPSGPDRMTHGDLTPANLLVDGERLVGIIDTGGFGPADPALDLVVAWHLFDSPAREVLRDELAIGEGEAARGGLGVPTVDGAGLVLPRVESGHERPRAQQSRADRRGVGPVTVIRPCGSGRGTRRRHRSLTGRSPLRQGAARSAARR